MQSAYTFDVFDTRNTAERQTIPLAQRADTAREIARRLSLRNGVHHVNVSRGNAFEEYERGERVSWSTAPLT